MEAALAHGDALIQNWWVLLVRAGLAILFGVLTLMAPGISLAVLVLVYGAYAFMDGAFAVVHALRRHSAHWGLLLLQGLVGLGVGVVTFVWPGLTVMTLLYLVAAWSLVGGALEIAMAIRLRKTITGEAWLALTGLVSVALGLALAFFPAAGALALVLWIGVYAIVLGVLFLGLSLRLGTWAKLHEGGGSPQDQGDRGQPAHGRPAHAASRG